MYVNTVFNTATVEYSHLSVKFARQSHIKDYCHDAYELMYIASGIGEYSAEGTVGKLRSGTVMLFAPYEYHKLIPALNTPFDVYSIKFSRKSLVVEVTERHDVIFNRDISSRIFSNQTVVIHSLLERIESASIMDEADRALCIKMLLSEILMLFSFNAENSFQIQDGVLGARVIKYLNDNIDRDLSLDYIAQRFFVSKYYLCRAFKKHNGISVHGYINRKRVLYAKSLIEGGESAADAAYRVGFGDYSAFYRAYVKLLGTSPTQDTAKKLSHGEDM